jgi:hypothetical protein
MAASDIVLDRQSSMPPGGPVSRRSAAGHHRNDPGGTGLEAQMQPTRLTLPQICTCGACGEVILEGASDPGPGYEHPRPVVIEAKGAFRLDGAGGIVCATCGNRSG